ncbi:MAG TPA: phosphatidylserine decarboxylase [Thermoanaerobaculales bacterium]|nr:phosphatidylserine decarboxylase [Thermoanaerobaculales bacterium]HQL29976.1 phosphatidylserine decarboxylase [Thermoanaerobaculales bacterium]HQN96847.1 phosphatidylserine decarboxylase [Thermoanaerobaculales bacterium]HQP44960.1 phosphatidylserine decarboxylase [Thermoanaerobaculales bacterium]
MIAPEGWPFVLISLCAAAAAGALGWLPLAVAFTACCAFCLFFFRDPRRACALAADIACSPADGKVIACGAAPEGTAPDGLPIRVSVFMSVFSVHVNRAPINATLVDYRYNPGRTLAAYSDKASLVNEQNLSLWEGPAGRIGLKQIAGVIARRIVFDHEPGAAVRRGDRIGLIRFGSRVDVFLPADAEVLVGVGDRVRAGSSPLARLGAA